MRRVVILTFLLVVLCLGVPVIAQDDGSPSLCTDGTWYCPDPNDSWRENWNWTCGWFFGHHYAGLYSSVSDWCLPPAPEAGPTGAIASSMMLANHLVPLKQEEGNGYRRSRALGTGS